MRTLEEVNKIYSDMKLTKTERLDAICWIEDRYSCCHCPACDTFVHHLGSDGVDCPDCERAFKVQLAEFDRRFSCS